MQFSKRMFLISLIFFFLLSIFLFKFYFSTRMQPTFTVIRLTDLNPTSFSESLLPTLKSVNGVKSVSALYDTNSIKVIYYPDHTSRYDLADIIDSAGFTAILPKAGSVLDKVDYRMYMR